MTMSRQVNISQNANDIQISTTQNRVVVVEGGSVDIVVTQPVTSVVEVLTGPMGPKGDLPTSGSVNFTGSYIISGSLVVTGSTTSTQGFTGSLLGTSSWAINAETASYVNPLNQNVVITGSLTVSGSSTFINIGPAIFSGSVTGKEGFTGSFLGNLTGTASYVEFSSVDGLPAFSSSVSSRVADLENFSSSLDATFATDAQLNSYTASANIRLNALEVESGSIRSSFSNFTASYTADSASFSSRVSASESDIAALQLFSSSLDATFATDAQLNAATASLSASISSLSSSYLSTSASFSSGINTNAGDIATLSSSFASFSSSYNTGSYTGSFTGDGGGLYNIPASGIVGLNLSQISSGSVSASISPNNGLQINTNTTVAGDLIIQGTASITYLNVTYESASVIYSSGSNQFGDAADDTQTLYGTVVIPTGSLTITGSVTSTDGFTGSLFGTSSWATNAITASYVLNAISSSYSATASYVESAQTASYVLNAVSSSYAQTASYIQLSGVDGFTNYSSSVSSSISALSSSFISFSASYNTGSFTGSFTGNLQGTSSWATNTISSSHALNADNAISASYALTASYVNPLIQDVYITGSLNLTGSAAFTGSTIINSLTYPTADNGEFSFIQTDGSGNLSLQYVNTLYEIVYNGEATQITKGTPVYISGSQGANSIAYRADAGDPTKMPVVYVVADNIDPADTGRAIALGLITGVNTTGYPGGTEIYVGVGGGWTSTRPTGSAIIQVLGYVTKEGNGGQGVVLNPGPANLPNITSGSVWVGNSGSIPVAIPTSSLSVASASFALTASYIDGGFY